MTSPKKNADSSFVAFIADALSGLEGLRSRSMFGGFGLYVKEDFFGIVWKGTLYFRVDDASRPEFEARGAKPFVYSRDGKSMTMTYFEVPADIIEDHEGLRRWAERAIASARDAKAAKTRKKRG